MCDAADRIKLFRVPLKRQVTQSAGKLGQPVVNYFAKVEIGTPRKAFNIQFDVDFADSFVPHFEAEPWKRNLHYLSGYSKARSSSSQQFGREKNLTYQECQLRGKSYADLVQVPAFDLHNDALPIMFKQNFLAISFVRYKRFRDLPVDGYFGLAPVYHSRLSTVNPLVNIYIERYIDERQFSLWFDERPESSPAGWIVFGGVDPTLYYGSVTWHELNRRPEDRWTLNLDSVKMDGKMLSIGCDADRCQAILSTAVSDTYGPRDEVQKLYNVLGALIDNSLPLIDCRRRGDLPSVKFIIDNQSYTLLPRYYVRRLPDNRRFRHDTCYVAILPHDEYHPRQWILGTYFLTNYYSVFDMARRRVGFATTRTSFP